MNAGVLVGFLPTRMMSARYPGAMTPALRPRAFAPLREAMVRGVVPEELLEEGCGFHLGEHVEVVVGGCSVGSEGDVDACGLHFGVGECPAYGEFHVADWVVDGGYAAFGEEGDVVFVEPAAVGCDAAFGEDAAVVEPGDDPHAVGFDAVGVFVGFVDVDVEGDVFFLRELGAPAESFFGDGVDGVGGDAGHDAGVVHGPDVCDGFFHDAAFGFEFVMVAAVDHAVGEAGPDAGFVDGFGDVFHHEVHVVGCGSFRGRRVLRPSRCRFR